MTRRALRSDQHRDNQEEVSTGIPHAAELYVREDGSTPRWTSPCLPLAQDDPSHERQPVITLPSRSWRWEPTNYPCARAYVKRTTRDFAAPFAAFEAGP